ncbi:MAG: hypothetical protein FWD38_05500 [Oscillospiraceae bacterium]|nr:hypothetical protein [Oscillospiraceae bacterium]
MRKHQQKQILEVLESLREVQAAELYADCQDAAINIGEFIESIKGEDTETVKLLEDYCELVFKASIGEAGIKALEKQLIRIENSVKNELRPDKIEMVFLSYKASMSDSIESIYMAAKADPTCDAYWIPIPYYEKNPDESFGKMHYEGSEFYKPNIECTDWREYNIAERRPDVIFTFSPYDAFNKLTSIHPDYYCERLRELTDMLVYVPYFVTGDDVGEDYTLCDGVLFAHKVIVQSEAIRKIYIHNYIKFEESGYSSEVYGKPQEKILALGSPKFDAVINAKKEDFTLPEKWLKLIQNPNGTTKKIILFCTTLTTVMNHPEQFLIKLQHVLDIFSKRDDIVLWWRPQPPTENTYNSMYPELSSEYKSIVSNYINNAFGIFDNTPELYRAITWSDAYYGDHSSVIYLYQVTCKPIMISNINLLDAEIPFEPTCMYATADKFWFSVRYFNALFCMDKKDWKLELVGSVPDEEDFINKYNTSLYYTPVERNNSLYFPPRLANEIAVMSLKNNTFSKVKTQKSDPEPTDRMFLAAISYENYIFFTPLLFPAIVRLDIITSEITYHDDWLRSLSKLSHDEAVGYFGLPCLIDNSIWLAYRQSNVIIEFCIITNKSIVHEVGNKNYRYSNVCFDGEAIWASPIRNTKTPLIKWNPRNGELIEFPKIQANENNKGFTAPVYCNGYVWLLPYKYGPVFKIDTHTNCCSESNELKLKPPCDETMQTALRTPISHSKNDCIYTYDFLYSLFIEYNNETGELREKKIIYSDDISDILRNKYANLYINKPDKINITNISYYYENLYMILNYYVEFINGKHGDIPAEILKRRIEATNALSLNTDGTAGQEIYKLTKKHAVN